MSERARGATADHDTIAGLLGWAAGALAAGSDTSRLDAEVLLAHTMGIDRARLVLNHDAEVEIEDAARFAGLVRRRLAGEPVAYLVGRRGFRDLELTVDNRVLIPRPETEGLVEAAVELLPAGASVLDVGTGSGAIALALAAERPDLRVQGADVSADAVTVAKRNATDLSLNVNFRVADLLAGAPPVDAVIANLPYVESEAALPVDVAGFEPSLALFGGEDGLGVIRRLASEMSERSWPAWGMLEIGESQGDAVADLLRGAGFAAVEVRPDLSGRDRVIIGHRAEGKG